MTPQELVKLEIMLIAQKCGDFTIPEVVTKDNVNRLYDGFVSQDGVGYENEFRQSGEETNIPAPYSRNYESLSVASKMSNGQWVGWIYWYGGGKYGNPEEINWMDEAYFLDCKEEEKTIIVRTFSKES